MYMTYSIKIKVKKTFIKSFTMEITYFLQEHLKAVSD